MTATMLGIHLVDRSEVALRRSIWVSLLYLTWVRTCLWPGSSLLKLKLAIGPYWYCRLCIQYGGLNFSVSLLIQICALYLYIIDINNMEKLTLSRSCCSFHCYNIFHEYHTYISISDTQLLILLLPLSFLLLLLLLLLVVVLLLLHLLVLLLLSQLIDVINYYGYNFITSFRIFRDLKHNYLVLPTRWRVSRLTDEKKYSTRKY